MKCTYRGLPKRHGPGSFIHCQYLEQKQYWVFLLSLSDSILLYAQTQDMKLRRSSDEVTGGAFIACLPIL